MKQQAFALQSEHLSVCLVQFKLLSSFTVWTAATVATVSSTVNCHTTKVGVGQDIREDCINESINDCVTTSCVENCTTIPAVRSTDAAHSKNRDEPPSRKTDSLRAQDHRRSLRHLAFLVGFYLLFITPYTGCATYLSVTGNYQCGSIELMAYLNWSPSQIHWWWSWFRKNSEWRRCRFLGAAKNNPRKPLATWRWMKSKYNRRLPWGMHHGLRDAARQRLTCKHWRDFSVL